MLERLTIECLERLAVGNSSALGGAYIRSSCVEEVSRSATEVARRCSCSSAEVRTNRTVLSRDCSRDWLLRGEVGRERASCVVIMSTWSC